jgi:hypothetical protein
MPDMLNDILDGCYKPVDTVTVLVAAICICSAINRAADRVVAAIKK